MIHLNFSHRTPIARQDESDFVLPVVIDILAPGEFSDSEGGASVRENRTATDSRDLESHVLENSDFDLTRLDVEDFRAADAVTDLDFDGRVPFESPDALLSDKQSRNTDSQDEADSEDSDFEDSVSETPESYRSAERLIDSDEPEYLVGRVWAERMDWFYAEECGFNVNSVCDARSGTWTQVLQTLSRNGGRSLRKDLNLDNFVSELVFLHEILIHPELKDRVSVMAAVIRGFTTDNTLILMHHDQSQSYHLEDWECHELGFKKIARSNLLLRDNHYRFPFGDTHVAGRHIDFRATAEHEAWLLEEWQSLMLDHPSL